MSRNMYTGVLLNQFPKAHLVFVLSIKRFNNCIQLFRSDTSTVLLVILQKTIKYKKINNQIYKYAD